MPRHADHATLRHHHNLLLLCILALFLILGFIALKYFWMRSSWTENSVQLQNGIQKYQRLNSIEDAQILGITLTTVPASLPIIRQPGQLENYIQAISKKTNRDFVIIDRKKNILADTVAANVGKVYSYDAGGEVAKTIFDANPRTFLEKSADYPNGINETVVQLKDNSGTIVGAIIISPSNIFN